MSRRRQGGGAISLLLALVVIGALAYLALRGGSGAATPAAPGAPLDCEHRIATLVQRTGGAGDAYRTGYEALPPACQALVPAPAAVSPPPEPTG